MKKTTIAIALMMTLVLALGCNQKSSTTTENVPAASSEQTASAQNLTPEQLGEIGAQIKKNPTDAEKILTEHGLNMASFEKAIRDVSADPAASRRYRDAYNKAV